MTTISTLVLCTLLGQVSGGSNFGSAIPVPQNSARRTAEPPAFVPDSRFGAPTPAQPSAAGPNSQQQLPSVLSSPQASDLQVNGGNFNPRNQTFTPQNNGANFNAAANSGFTPRNTVPSTVAQANAEAAAEDTAAMQLVRQAFPTPDDAGSDTRPLTLKEVIAATPDRTRRAAAIRTYWEAATLLADWQFTAEEHALIRQATAPPNTPQQAALTAAIAAAEARLVEAQMSASSARSALGELVPTTSADDRSPMPVDTPLVGDYNTHFEKLFAARVAPAGLKQIHQTLPLRKDLVEARAAAVFAAADSVDQQRSAYQNGRASLNDLLRSLENLRTQRGAFLGALRDYNLDIAEYALGTSQPNDTPEKVVSMMIKTPQSSANTVVAPARPNVMIMPAGANAPTVATPTLATPIRSTPTLSTPNALIPQGSPQVTPPAVVNPVIRTNVNTPTVATPTIAPPPVTPNVSAPASTRVADQSSAAAAADVGRPTTERVLGTLREVPSQTPTPAFQPNSGDDLSAPSTSGSSRFGQPQSQLTLPPTTGASRFGASISAGGQGSEAAGTSAQAEAAGGSSTIITPSDNLPILPPPAP